MLTTLSMPAVEAALDDYIKSAAMPCPYARLPIRYLPLDDVDSFDVSLTLVRELREFFADTSISILCIVPRLQPNCPRVARAQAYQLRRQLHQLDLEAAGMLTQEVAVRLREQYEAWSDDSESFLGPRIVVDAMDIMTTAFNHTYPAEHPRYAPYACLVVIRTRDLQAIHERQPDLSLEIAVHSKCKLLRSMLDDTAGIELAAMRREYPQWVHCLSFYREFVTGYYTAGYRMDPRTLPQLHNTRRRCAEAMRSDRFVASLTAFRAMAYASPDVPTLARLLEQNPRITVFDVAKVVFGDVSGMYVPQS